MEKIEIKDFVGIKDITLEIKQINILIGPQASGKSIIAKLLFYFKSFIFEIISAAEQPKSKKDLDRDYKRKFEQYFPSSSWGKEKFKIRYYIGENFIEVSSKRSTTQNKSPEIVLSYSDFYKDQFTNLRTVIQKQNKKVAEQEIQISILSRLDSSYDITKSFLSTVSNLNRITAFSQLYIPAGRSFFAHLKSSIFTFLSENNAVDPFLIEFGTYYEQAKNPIRRELFSRKTVKNPDLHHEIASLNKKILCGEYLQKDGEDYLKVKGSRQIGIANSSSGQQETLPLAIILGTIAFTNPKIGGSSVYIEEPEAHIFPAAQKDIVELISTVYNSRKDSLQFLITTHSPYILTAFNNLLQAGLLAVGATEEKIKKISHNVPKTRFLNPEEIAVYSLSDGYCQSILDSETGLINTNIIDEVSNELAIQFDELLDIDE